MVLQLVAVYGSWHLGQLQVGLSRAIRLTQCSSVHITTREPLPMQIDGEPFLQAPATLQVHLCPPQTWRDLAVCLRTLDIDVLD